MQQKKNRRPGRTARRLRGIEERLDIIICGINRINARLLNVERQQREEFTDATIGRLHAAAVRMREAAGMELQATIGRYGKDSI